jgi:hypothetical protein
MVTVTLPVEPLPTTAVICVAAITLKLEAAVPPNLTAVAPPRLVPVMITQAPVPADVGVNELIVGADIAAPAGSVISRLMPNTSTRRNRILKAFLFTF